MSENTATPKNLRDLGEFAKLVDFSGKMIRRAWTTYKPGFDCSELKVEISQNLVPRVSKVCDSVLVRSEEGLKISGFQRFE